MKIGDLVMTTAIEVRTDPTPRPAMRASFKANKGSAFVFLNFGTVQSTDEVDDRVQKVMSALGWIPCDDVDALRAALVAAEAQAEVNGNQSSDGAPSTGEASKGELA
jgi:hypothetical protein